MKLLSVDSFFTRIRWFLILQPLVFFFFVFPIGATAEFLSGEPFSPEYQPGQVLVQYADQTAPHGSYAHEFVGVARNDDSTAPEIWQLHVADDLTVPEAIEELKNDPTVISAEPNIIRRMTIIPDDELYSSQWHLQSTAGVDGEAAWEIQTGSSDVIVAVVDTGVDTDHVDLADNMWVNPNEVAGNSEDDDGNGYIDDVSGYDFVDDDIDPNPDPDGRDNDGYAGADTGVTHGTHVAGIIAAVGNNGVGVSGVAWNISILPIKVLDDEGAGTDADIAEGIIYAADLGVDIINMSLGGFGSTTVLEEAVEYAKNQGALVISAVGNDGASVDQNPFYPACYDGVLGVTSTDDNNVPSYFSNYGTDCTDVAAPGEMILSTLYTDDPANDFTDDYGWMSGTSMATPVVSGVAALVKSDQPDLTRSQLTDVVVLTSEDVGLEEEYGRGRVDALLALQGTAVINRPSGTGGINAYNSEKKKKSYTSGARTADRQPYFNWPEATDDDGIAGYYVYFGIDEDADPEVDGVFQTQRRFVPEQLSGNEVSHFLRVTSEDTEGNVSSDVSTFEYVIDTAVAQAKQISTESNGNGIRVSWKKVSGEHVQTYRIVRSVMNSEAESSPEVVGTVAHPATTFNDTHVRRDRIYNYRVRAVDDVENQSTSRSDRSVFVARERLVFVPGTGGGPLVRIYNTKRRTFEQSWFAGSVLLRTGLEVAVGNLNSNRKDEVIIGFGSGSEPRVKVFDSTGTLRASFLAYEESFTGGVRVASGDVNNDGIDEIITAPGPGRSPLIKVFDANGVLQTSFNALDGQFSGGVYVTTLNWDGKRGSEVGVSAGSGGGPQVVVYNAVQGKMVASFFAYDSAYHGGLRVAGLEPSNRDTDVLVTSPLTGAVDVRRFVRSDDSVKELGRSSGFSTDYVGGGTVAAGDIDYRGSDHLFVGSNGGRQATVNMYSSTGGTLLETIYPFGVFDGPINIAAGWVY